MDKVTDSGIKPMDLLIDFKELQDYITNFHNMLIMLSRDIALHRCVVREDI